MRRRLLVVTVLTASCAPSKGTCPEAVAPPAVATVTVPPTSPCPTEALAPPPAEPVASTTADVAPVEPVAPVAIGPAKDGPRGVRPCEFRESVDTYARSCTVKQEADGSLTVTAKGTALNPAHGFLLRMGGGPGAFDVSGQLDAFGICRGPFAGRMITVLDGAKKTYEVRFNEHCMIVIR
jgi:hypothetical protein